MDINGTINCQDIVSVGTIISLSIIVHAVEYFDHLNIDKAMTLNSTLSQQLPISCSNRHVSLLTLSSRSSQSSIIYL